MYDLIFKAWSWIPWILGLGTIGWIALALLAPGVLNVISPLLRGLSEGVVALWKILYEGLTDILDSWKTLATVALLIWAASNYITWKETHKSVDRASTPTVTRPVGTQSQKVAPSQNKEKPAFSLDGWDWFHVK